jgi:hypothetical protein
MMALEMSGAGVVRHPQLAESITIWQNARCRSQSCKLALPQHLQVGCARAAAAAGTPGQACDSQRPLASAAGPGTTRPTHPAPTPQVAAFTAWQLHQLPPADAPLIRSWRYPEPEALTQAALQQQVKAQLAAIGAAAVVPKVREKM